MQLSYDPAISLLSIYYKELKARIQTDIDKFMFIAALLTIVKSGKDLSIGRKMDK